MGCCVVVVVCSCMKPNEKPDFFSAKRLKRKRGAKAPL